MKKVSDTEKGNKSVDPSRLEARMEKLAKNPAFFKKMENVVRREEHVLTIKSSYALGAKEVQQIKQKLNLETRASLRVSKVVDPLLLLGIIVKYKDYYFDYSLKGQLVRLFESLEA
ncbi:hypothetical protein COU88_04500 [Candidatus Roizmanbacteria bacterium CG10_big_fil_rev_8_21_14_0_10_39_6]|uniref:Uncharacterized protein n=1 Tax=Candidatus Roizmanbacteria bacterium CG10_big_fil_rev_8_21_14_0_10_39_6 TaxID=1974853 RepID=A0A2M8KRG9_9BACT|nr:MAG: hypothetical protein COU88_04500 [Candidatus Roizmanbacteria bacterium CG10_big_fil_rev_8_21_14_0_10_39_6]